MSIVRTLCCVVLMGIGLAGCDSSEATAPALSEWCTEPGRDASGNTVLTLVKRPEASLPPQIAVSFNSQPEVTFVDDGTGLDAKANDGIYTHSAKTQVTPTEHSCNPVLMTSPAGTTQVSSLGSGYGSIAEPLKVSGKCTATGGNCCIGASFGLPCICISCSITVSF